MVGESAETLGGGPDQYPANMPTEVPCVGGIAPWTLCSCQTKTCEMLLAPVHNKTGEHLCSLTGPNHDKGVHRGVGGVLLLVNIICCVINAEGLD